MNIFYKMIIGGLISLFTFNYANATEKAAYNSFAGIAAGVSFDLFNGEVPQNMQKKFALEVSPVFQLPVNGINMYVAPNAQYSNQFKTAGLGLNGYLELKRTDNYTVLWGINTILVEGAYTDSSGIDYNNLMTGGINFVINWRDLYGLSPILSISQYWTGEVTDGVTVSNKPSRYTGIAIGLLF